MKLLPVLLLCCLPILAQSETQQAPKGYPTMFRVSRAWIAPSVMFGNQGGCSMDLETAGQILSVSSPPGMFGPCKAFQPGAIVWGHIHRVLGAVVDVLDTTGTKAKSRRYVIENVTLVDPAVQK